MNVRPLFGRAEAYRVNKAYHPTTMFGRERVAARPEQGTQCPTPTSHEGATMPHPYPGVLTVRTRDGQTFTGPALIGPRAVEIVTRPAAAETARVWFDNVAEVIAR